MKPEYVTFEQIAKLEAAKPGSLGYEHELQDLFSAFMRRELSNVLLANHIGLNQYGHFLVQPDTKGKGDPKAVVIPPAKQITPEQWRDAAKAFSNAGTGLKEYSISEIADAPINLWGNHVQRIYIEQLYTSHTEATKWRKQRRSVFSKTPTKGIQRNQDPAASARRLADYQRVELELQSVRRKMRKATDRAVAKEVERRLRGKVSIGFEAIRQIDKGTYEPINRLKKLSEVIDTQ